MSAFSGMDMLLSGAFSHSEHKREHLLVEKLSKTVDSLGMAVEICGQVGGQEPCRGEKSNGERFARETRRPARGWANLDSAKAML